jgi:hypothetical protein
MQTTLQPGLQGMAATELKLCCVRAMSGRENIAKRTKMPRLRNHLATVNRFIFFPFFLAVISCWFDFPVIAQRRPDEMSERGDDTRYLQEDASAFVNKIRRPADCSAGLLEGNLLYVRSEATTEMMAAVIGELVVRLGIAFVEALAVVIADKAALENEWIESAMRQRVRPPFDQSGVEALPLFDQLPSSVYAAVAVTVEASQSLRESARAVDGPCGDYERCANSEWKSDLFDKFDVHVCPPSFSSTWDHHCRYSNCDSALRQCILHLAGHDLLSA